MTCLYKRLFLDYTYGLDRIYTREDIEKAKSSPSFEREYNLKYLGKVGNVFHTLDIEAAICTQQEGKEMMDWSTNMMIGRSMGIDVHGEILKVCYRHYPIQKQKGRSFLCRKF